MTLHHYLIDHGLKLDERTVSMIGQKVSDRYRDKYKSSPYKHRVKGLIGKINDYEISFLESCTDLIISFINPAVENTNE